MFKIRKRKLTKESFHDELTNAFNKEPVDPYEYAYRVHYDDLNTLAEMYGLKGIHGISIVIQNIISAFVTGNQQVIEDDYRRYESGQAFSFVYQLTRMCRDKNAIAHDDRLDAVTMAVSYWLEHMDVEGEAEQETTEDDFESWLTEGIIGYRYEHKTNKCLNNVKVLRL